uniref:Protein bric-a-brac 2 n=1 Tax=Cacopsylla melanoneura TaxID=428564 RepID=A0A8D8YJ65_9HEMI
MDPQLDAQQFCLRWHNYQSSLLSTLPQLLDGNDLTDVTLSAGGRNLKAHKVVLSACSDYFKQLFKEIDNYQHPVIILPGVEFSDLYALVTFMYNGEVNIYQQQLSCLLSMADTLHIRGLAEFTGDPQDYSTNKHSNSSSPSSHSSTPNTSGSKINKRQRMSSQPGATTNNTSDMNLLNKTPTPTECPPSWFLDTNGTSNEVQDLSRKASTSGQNCDMNTINSSTSIDCLQNVCKNVSSRATTGSPESVGTPDPCLMGGLGPSVFPTSSPSKPSKSPGSGAAGNNSKLFATCFVCGKQLSNQYNLRVHMETHQNAFYACSSCNHVSRSRDALRKHVSYRHPHVSP